MCAVAINFPGWIMGSRPRRTDGRTDASFYLSSSADSSVDHAHHCMRGESPGPTEPGLICTATERTKYFKEVVIQGIFIVKIFDIASSQSQVS